MPLQGAFEVEEVCAVDRFGGLALRMTSKVTMLTVSEPTTLGTLGDRALSRLGMYLDRVRTGSSVGTIVLANNPSGGNGRFGSFMTNTSVTRVMGFATPRTHTFKVGTSRPFFGLVGVHRIAVTTMGKFTLNKKYRVSVTYSVHVTDRGTVFKRPRYNLKVVPKFNNARELTHLMNVKHTGRVVFAYSGMSTGRTCHVNLMGGMITGRRLVPATGTVTTGVVSGKDCTMSITGTTVGGNCSVSVGGTIRVRTGLFNIIGSARSGGRKVNTFLRGETTALASFWGRARNSGKQCRGSCHPFLPCFEVKGVRLC